MNRPFTAPRLLGILGLFGMLSSIGCGQGNGGLGDHDPTLATEQARSFGLMSVTYTRDTQAVPSASPLQLVTTAQFVRYSAVGKSQVARLLALPLAPDADLPGRDRCQLYDLTVDLGEQGMVTSDEMASVELLEAGDLSVTTSAGSMSLVPRHYPGLLPFIFGVVYSEAKPEGVETAGIVEVKSLGGEAVGAFAAASESPAFPKLGALPNERDAAGPLQLSWTAGGGATDDIFYVELRRIDAKDLSGGARDGADRALAERVLRCRPADDGDFSVPAAALARLGMAPGSRLQVDAARVRRASFSAQGLEQAELQITARDRKTIAFR